MPSHRCLHSATFTHISSLSCHHTDTFTNTYNHTCVFTHYNSETPSIEAVCHPSLHIMTNVYQSLQSFLVQCLSTSLTELHTCGVHCLQLQSVTSQDVLESDWFPFDTHVRALAPRRLLLFIRTNFPSSFFLSSCILSSVSSMAMKSLQPRGLTSIYLLMI